MCNWYIKSSGELESSIFCHMRNWNCKITFFQSVPLRKLTVWLQIVNPKVVSSFPPQPSWKLTPLKLASMLDLEGSLYPFFVATSKNNCISNPSLFNFIILILPSLVTLSINLFNIQAIQVSLMGTSKNQFPAFNFAIQHQKNETWAANRIPDTYFMYLSGLEAPHSRAFPAKGYSYPVTASFRLKKE